MRVRRTPNPPRRGAQAVEVAIVLPVVMMLILGTFSTAMGVYYYQLVATLAREGARYASVHGSQYVQPPPAGYGGTPVYASDIYLNAIKPMAVGLNLGNLTYTVQWGTAVSGSWVWTSWVSSSTSLTTSPPGPSPPGLYNGVQVTVTYKWTPDLYITGPISLTSTSVMPMSF